MEFALSSSSALATLCATLMLLCGVAAAMMFQLANARILANKHHRDRYNPIAGLITFGVMNCIVFLLSVICVVYLVVDFLKTI